MSGFRRAARAGTPALAMGGWLFAELAIVLTVIAMASADPGVAPVPAPPNEPRPTPTTVAAPGILLTPVEFRIAVPAAGDEAGTAARFQSELNRVVGPNRKVGLVLMFGVSRDPGAALGGSDVSRRLVGIVRGLPALGSAADIRAYLGDSEDGAPGEVRVELFLLNRP